MDPRIYNELDSSIHKISNSMSLNEDERKMINTQLSELLEYRLLPAMKEEDEDFKNLFQRLHYSGSYYENLRICKCNEFDLNLELRSQNKSQKFLQVHYTENCPGFVQLEYLSGDSIKKWVNGRGFVMQNKVLSWLQGVVDKALRKISNGRWHKSTLGRWAAQQPNSQGWNRRFPGHRAAVFAYAEAPHPHAKNHRFRRRGVASSQFTEPMPQWSQRQHSPGRWAAQQPNSQAPRRRFRHHRAAAFLGTDRPHCWVSSQRFSGKRSNYFSGVKPTLRRVCRKMSGPAVTLYVEYVPGEVFSVDLVPVFVLDCSQWPRPPVRQPVITNDTFAEQWCVVPKPNNHVDQYGNVGTFWRMSFYNQEKVILNNKNHLKNALKLMKLLRDSEGWHSLSSYYLKTVFLWSVMENDSRYWNNGIGVLFMNMLKTLRDYLKNRPSIPFFWDNRYNVLNSVDVQEIHKIGNRLDNIIRYIDRELHNGNSTCIEFLFRRSDRGNNLSRAGSPSESTQQASELQAQQASELQVQQASELQAQQAVGWGEIASGIGVVAAVAAAGTFLWWRHSQNQRR